MSVYNKNKNMFKSIKNGWQLIKESIKVFNRHPRFIIPLLMVWAVYAPIILYLKFYIDWNGYTLFQSMVVILAIVFIFAWLLSVSCSILLELIQQLESGQKTSLFSAADHTFRHNMATMMPIVFIWTIAWFILLLVQVILSDDENRKSESFTAESAAKTLAGYGDFSLSDTFFAALQKGIRMIVFLILPAIAWENLGFYQSIKRGFSVFRKNLATFATGFVLTEFATGIIFLPPAIMFYLSGNTNIIFPEWVWPATIIYLAFGWSYSIYLEQMFAAELYLWNMRWEKETALAVSKGQSVPHINKVPRPSLLDETHELIPDSRDIGLA